MALEDGDAESAQPLDVIVRREVRALHLVAEIVHHLGDARHADAADADEVDDSDIERQRPHAAFLFTAVSLLVEVFATAAAGAGRPAPVTSPEGRRVGKEVGGQFKLRGAQY